MQRGVQGPLLSINFAFWIPQRKDDEGITLWAGQTVKWVFSLHDIPKDPWGDPPYDTAHIELQFSTVPFSTKYLSDYLHPARLVYMQNERGFISRNEPFLIPFSEFASLYEELGDETIIYYVRGVIYYEGDAKHVYTTGTTDGTSLIAWATRQYVVYYTGDWDFYFNQNHRIPLGDPEEVVIPSAIPQVTVYNYKPPRWELPHPEEYFEVTRRITVNEWGFRLINSEIGEKLYPYSYHLFSENMTAQQYQEKLDRMVPVGAWFQVVPKTKNWFEKIVSDFVSLLDQIYTSIQKTYNGLKQKLVNVLANSLGSVFGGKEFFRKVITALVDYGLASIGLPPSLPNFDVLALDSLDYLVRVAMDEAADAMGIPLDELPIDVKEKVSKEVRNGFTNLRTGNQNPFGVDFLRYATEATYRPPVVYISIYNDKDVASVPGTASVWIQNTSRQDIFYSESVYVPSLKPCEYVTIPIYMRNANKVTLSAYHKYLDNDTSIGTVELVVAVNFDVPDASVVAQQQGIEGPGGFDHPDIFVYDRDPDTGLYIENFVIMNRYSFFEVVN